ncbi:MAG TPA: YfhO family protein, partial [Verrucomicrobiae bacterium]|nr:YfhO family protein [Verrucomicrobiae bacterium]
VVFRGDPPPDVHPAFISPDYWVMENTGALPRAFVPRHVEVAADEKERLGRLHQPEFDARETAYIETNLALPDVCEGSAEIVAEIPARVTLAVKMQTPGLVVLGDLWDKGWRAYLDGKSVPIYRTDHALRGVQVPAGNATLEFRYEPVSLAWGLRLAGISLLVLFFCGVTAFRVRQKLTEDGRAI